MAEALSYKYYVPTQYIVLMTSDVRVFFCVCTFIVRVYIHIYDVYINVTRTMTVTPHYYITSITKQHVLHDNTTMIVITVL